MATPNMDIKMMTRDEVNAELLKQLSDEINDSNLYYKLSKAAACSCDEWKDHPELAKCLWEISLEEYTHAKFIHSHLLKACITIPDDVEHKYQALRIRAEEMYEPEIRCRIDSILYD